MWAWNRAINFLTLLVIIFLVTHRNWLPSFQPVVFSKHFLKLFVLDSCLASSQSCFYSLFFFLLQLSLLSTYTVPTMPWTIIYNYLTIEEYVLFFIRLSTILAGHFMHPLCPAVQVIFLEQHLWGGMTGLAGLWAFKDILLCAWYIVNIQQITAAEESDRQREWSETLKQTSPVTFEKQMSGALLDSEIVNIQLLLRVSKEWHRSLLKARTEWQFT